MVRRENRKLSGLGLASLMVATLIIGGCAHYGKYPDESQTSKWKYISQITPKPKPSQKKPIISAKKSSKGLIIVRKKDTIYGISKRYRVTLRSLIQVNNLRPPYRLLVGQHLKLPTFKTYRVKKGDTVYNLAQRNNFEVQEFAKLNHLKYPYRIFIGQKIRLSFKTAKKKIVQKKLKNFASQSRKLNSFIWPIKGRILSSYGRKPHGLFNDGINILSKKGKKVKAADYGVVVHSSNIMQGYGNLILIKHSNGWVTVYAHNSKILVKKGQKISRGQVIAEIGNTGRVMKSQLHFEIRRYNQSINPIKRLPKI